MIEDGDGGGGGGILKVSDERFLGNSDFHTSPESLNFPSTLLRLPMLKCATVILRYPWSVKRAYFQRHSLNLAAWTNRQENMTGCVRAAGMEDLCLTSLHDTLHPRGLVK